MDRKRYVANALLPLLVIAHCAVAQPEEEAGSSESDRLGEIGLDTRSSEQSIEQGVYLRGGAVWNSYADADISADTSGFGSLDDSSEFESAVAGVFAVGYHRKGGRHGFRVEGELSHERTDGEVDGGLSTEYSFTSFAANVYSDAGTGRWTVYLGGGLGGSVVEFDNDLGSGDGEGLFVQLMGGLEFQVSGPLTTCAGMRWRFYDDIELEDDLGDTATIDGLRSWA